MISELMLLNLVLVEVEVPLFSSGGVQLIQGGFDRTPIRYTYLRLPAISTSVGSGNLWQRVDA